MDITHNESEKRFETTVDGSLAVAAYELEPGKLVLTHTSVPRELSGRGIANLLAKKAMEHARANNLRVVPQCSFMAGFIERNPEYQDLM